MLEPFQNCFFHSFQGPLGLSADDSYELRYLSKDSDNIEGREIREGARGRISTRAKVENHDLFYRHGYETVVLNLGKQTRIIKGVQVGKVVYINFRSHSKKGVSCRLYQFKEKHLLPTQVKPFLPIFNNQTHTFVGLMSYLILLDEQLPAIEVGYLSAIN